MADAERRVARTAVARGRLEGHEANLRRAKGAGGGHGPPGRPASGGGSAGPNPAGGTTRETTISGP